LEKLDKEQRLARAAEVGERMRGFIADPLISAWFDKAISTATDAMVEASVTGDAQQAIHKGLTVNILRQVRDLMGRAEAEGKRAADELHKRRQRSE